MKPFNPEGRNLKVPPAWPTCPICTVPIPPACLTCQVCHDGNPSGIIAERRREAEERLPTPDRSRPAAELAADIRRSGRAARVMEAWTRGQDIPASTVQAAGDEELAREAFGPRSQQPGRESSHRDIYIEDLRITLDGGEELAGIEALDVMLYRSGEEADPVFEAVWLAEARSIVAGALWSLPDDLLDALLSVMTRDPEPDELAAKLGCDRRTIYRRADRALAQLRRHAAIHSLWKTEKPRADVSQVEPTPPYPYRGSETLPKEL